MSQPIQFLHLGLGAFHRAHQAVFIKQNIASVSMRKSDVADAFILTFASDAATVSWGRKADWGKPMKRLIRGLV